MGERKGGKSNKGKFLTGGQLGLNPIMDWNHVNASRIILPKNRKLEYLPAPTSLLFEGCSQEC